MRRLWLCRAPLAHRYDGRYDESVVGDGLLQIGHLAPAGDMLEYVVEPKLDAGETGLPDKTYLLHQGLWLDGTGVEAKSEGHGD